MKIALPLLLGITISWLMVSTAGAYSVRGQASVIDADSIQIQGVRIRILNIDAPEAGQYCFKRNESMDAWWCGHQAATALADWLAAQTVTCEVTTKGLRGGWLSRCVVAGQDIAEWLAENGWAVPSRSCDREAIRLAAELARSAQLGIWSSGFTLPWEWRKTR